MILCFYSITDTTGSLMGWYIVIDPGTVTVISSCLKTTTGSRAGYLMLNCISYYWGIDICMAMSHVCLRAPDTGFIIDIVDYYRNSLKMRFCCCKVT